MNRTVELERLKYLDDLRYSFGKHVFSYSFLLGDLKMPDEGRRKHENTWNYVSVA